MPSLLSQWGWSQTIVGLLIVAGLVLLWRKTGASEQKTRFDVFIARAKGIAEVLAIPIAAYWAFTHFETAEAPSLAPRPQFESKDLIWFDSPIADECFGKLEFKLKNIGKVNFTIEDVVVSAWVKPVAPLSNGTLDAVDPSALSSGPDGKEFPLGDQLKGEYRPDQSVEESFVYRFKRQPGKIAIVRLSAKALGSQPTGPIHEYRWDFVCGETQAPWKP